MTKRRLWPRLLFQWARRPYTSCYSGDLVVHMVSAPRGTGIVAAMIPKKVLQFAGIDFYFTITIHFFEISQIG